MQYITHNRVAHTHTRARTPPTGPGRVALRLSPHGGSNLKFYDCTGDDADEVYAHVRALFYCVGVRACVSALLIIIIVIAACAAAAAAAAENVDVLLFPRCLLV